MSSKLFQLFACGYLAGWLPQFAASQEQRAVDQATRPAATIQDVEWIAGHWRGEALGGQFEETWNPPLGGSMLGMFKLVGENQLRFCEIMIIIPKDDSLLLQLKHFGPGLVGWEDKDKCMEMPLVRLTKNEAQFDQITFQRIDRQHMRITVMTERSGELRELKFECVRYEPPQQSAE